MFQIQTCLCTLYIFDICTQCTLDSQPQGRRFIKIPGGGHIYQGNILGHDGIGGGGGLGAPHFPPQPGPDCFRVMTQRGGGAQKRREGKKEESGKKSIFFNVSMYICTICILRLRI